MNWQKFLRRTTATVLIGASVLTASVVVAATPQERVQQYTQQIQSNPNNAEAYNERGVAYYDLKQFDRAIQDFSKAIQLNPNYALAYINRGIAYGTLERLERELQDYNKAIQINPRYGRAYYCRGCCYLARGNKAKAEADFARARELGYKSKS